MTYDLVNCSLVPAEEWEAMIAEFSERGEFCNAIWRAYDVGVRGWLKEAEEFCIGKERQLAFRVDGNLVGVARVTPAPRNEANGKVGYYIRPSKRGRLYAPVLLRLIEDYCKAWRVENITAVTDAENTASIRSLTAARWLLTGRSFPWNDGRLGLEFMPEK